MKKVLSSKGIFEITNSLFESIKKNNPELLEGMESDDKNKENISLIQNICDEIGYNDISNAMNLYNEYKEMGRDIDDFKKELKNIKEKNNKDNSEKKYKLPNVLTTNKNKNNSQSSTNSYKQIAIRNNNVIQMNNKEKNDDNDNNDNNNINKKKESLKKDIFNIIKNILPNMGDNYVLKIIERFMNIFNEKCNKLSNLNEIDKNYNYIIQKAIYECIEFRVYIYRLNNEQNNIEESFKKIFKNKKILKENNQNNINYDDNLCNVFSNSGIEGIRNMYPRIADEVQRQALEISNELYRRWYNNHYNQSEQNRQNNNNQNQQSQNDDNNQNNNVENDDEENQMNFEEYIENFDGTEPLEINNFIKEELRPLNLDENGIKNVIDRYIKKYNLEKYINDSNISSEEKNKIIILKNNLLRMNEQIKADVDEMTKYLNHLQNNRG